MLDTADVAYLHKLRQSKRPKKLIGAFLLLLLALRRLREDAQRMEIERDLAPSVAALGSGLARYVGHQTHSRPAARPIAASLLAAIALHVAHAQQLARAEREERLGLIARAELQRATAEATRQAADGHMLTRETTSANPCKRCEALAGTYDYPWPDDVFYSHPNCACQWETNAGEEVA